MSKMIIVSNRLPVSIRVDNDEIQATLSTGGLATGLIGLMETEGAIWVGWDGCDPSLGQEKRKILLEELRKERLEVVPLSAEDIRSYYNEVSNGVIWPLYHYQIDKIPLTLSGWENYIEVNRKFAERIAALYSPGDFIWVHDFHLQLLPSLLRAMLPNAVIGFFLHIPFPSCEIFRVVPWRKEILEGMLGADVIGFHTRGYANNFQDSVLSVLGIDTVAESLHYGERRVRIGAFPLGIDPARVRDRLSSKQSDLAEAVTRLKTEQKIEKVILSVDRMDYTKGIPRKFLSIEKLLDDHVELRGKIVFIQIAAPTRDDVEAYEEYRENVEGLVGRINGKYAMPGYQPIHYISRSYPQDEIFNLYQLVDIMMVTPLRDGMNLVAKEFVAVRDDLDAVLVLSEFAGAAEELSEAVLVNPYDIAHTARGLYQGIRMEGRERVERMKVLRRRIAHFDASTWARRFMDFFYNSFDSSKDHQVPEELAGLTSEISERIILFLDYDGTLFPIVQVPQMAMPDASLLKMLTGLSDSERFEIHILSGRPKATMEEWFPFSNIHLHAEHGAISRSPKTETWTSILDPSESSEWKPFVKKVLSEYTRTTDGSFVEEKEHSLVWHYRMAESDHAEEMAKALRVHARSLFSPLGLEVLAGKKNVEIRQIGVNKGRVVKRILRQQTQTVFPIAIGDDVTDEDMFEAIGNRGMTIVVGDHWSRARHRVRDPSDVRLFLESIAALDRDKTENCG